MSLISKPRLKARLWTQFPLIYVHSRFDSFLGSPLSLFRMLGKRRRDWSWITPLACKLRIGRWVGRDKSQSTSLRWEPISRGREKLALNGEFWLFSSCNAFYIELPFWKSHLWNWNRKSSYRRVALAASLPAPSPFSSAGAFSFSIWTSSSLSCLLISRLFHPYLLHWLLNFFLFLNQSDFQRPPGTPPTETETSGSRRLDLALGVTPSLPSTSTPWSKASLSWPFTFIRGVWTSSEDEERNLVCEIEKVVQIYHFLQSNKIERRGIFILKPYSLMN